MNRLNRLFEKFGANDSAAKWAVMSDAMRAMRSLRGGEYDDLFRAYEDLNGGGELAYDAALSALINGWRRNSSGRLPFGKINGEMWFDCEVPMSDDTALKVVCDATQAYRDGLKEERAIREKLLEKRKERRKMRKALRSSGFEEMWCKVETGMLGSATIDIVIDGKVHSFEGALMSIMKYDESLDKKKRIC